MTSTPHDALFKAVFSQPEHAAVELRSVLPPALVERIDWSTLALEAGSYVDEALRERQSDLLFRAALGEQEVLLYVLFEHQSEPDRGMAFRLLRYEVRIWERWAREAPGHPLPPILPVVLSHSERGWNVPLSFEELVELGDSGEVLLPFLPRFRFLVDDLSRETDAELARRVSSLYVRLVLMLLRDGRRVPLPDLVRRALDVWREVERSSPAEAIALLIRYILLISDEAEHGSFVDVVDSIGPRTKEEAMRSIADKIFDEGKAEGLAQGLAAGRAEGNAEGKAEGRAEGLAVGRAEGQRATLRRLLRLKFGSLGPDDEARIEAAPLALLEVWVERVLTADTIAAVLTSGGGPRE